MTEYKIVYLIVGRQDPEQPPLWRMAGAAFPCKDGSLNLRLDMHPGLRFNIRDPKFSGPEEIDQTAYSNGNGAGQEATTQTPTNGRADDDIPF